MGLFDYVYLECAVPEEARGVRRWQTKDIDEDPFMVKYMIAADGRLLHERVRYEDRSDKDADPGTLASVRGCMTPIHEGWDEVPEVHGDIGLASDDGPPYGIRLVARFTNGRLQSISSTADGETTP